MTRKLRVTARKTNQRSAECQESSNGGETGLSISRHHGGEMDEHGVQIWVGYSGGKESSFRTGSSIGVGHRLTDLEEFPKQGCQNGLRSRGDRGAVDQVFVLENLLRKDLFGE